MNRTYTTTRTIDGESLELTMTVIGTSATYMDEHGRDLRRRAISTDKATAAQIQDAIDALNEQDEKDREMHERGGRLEGRRN